jgi:hypothetical protein
MHANARYTCDKTYSVFVADVDVLNRDLKVKNYVVYYGLYSAGLNFHEGSKC